MQRVITSTRLALALTVTVLLTAVTIPLVAEPANGGPGFTPHGCPPNC